MAENLPVNFSIPAEPVIASYDFYDFAEGTGIKTFYACASVDSGGTDYFLTADVIYSDPKSTLAVNTVKVLDFNLSAFNTPKIIRGTAAINVNYSMYTDNPGTHNCTLKFEFKKVSTATTTILTLTSANLPVVGGAAAVSGLLCLTGIIPETIFGLGDILRVTATLTANDGNCTSIKMGHDPQDRADPDYDLEKTQLKVNIPFKIPL